MRIDVETNEEQDSQLSGLTEIPSGPTGRYRLSLGEWLNQDRIQELRSKLLAENGKARIPVHLGAQVVGYIRLGDDGRLRWEPEQPELPSAAAPVVAEAYAVDREALGRLVRDEWLAWAREQPGPKQSWLQVWEQLSEAEREVDRRIGERLYAEGAGFRRLAVETLEAAAGKTIPSERAAGLIRYHLQNADICEADRAELAAFADTLDPSGRA